MSEPRDDTPEPGRAPRPAADPEHKPGGYYYDDGTGYETYSPGPEDEAGDEDGPHAARTPPPEPPSQDAPAAPALPANGRAPRAAPRGLLPARSINFDMNGCRQ